MVSKREVDVLVQAGELWAKFSERLSLLPRHLQRDFLSDLEVAMENRLKVLEASV